MLNPYKRPQISNPRKLAKEKTLVRMYGLKTIFKLPGDAATGKTQNEGRNKQGDIASIVSASITCCSPVQEVPTACVGHQPACHERPGHTHKRLVSDIAWQGMHVPCGAAKLLEVVEWFSRLRATPEVVAALFCQRPMLLTVPPTTASAVTGWLRSKLSWSGSIVLRLLKRNS